MSPSHRGIAQRSFLFAQAFPLIACSIFSIGCAGLQASASEIPSWQALVAQYQHLKPNSRTFAAAPS